MDNLNKKSDPTSKKSAQSDYDTGIYNIELEKDELQDTKGILKNKKRYFILVAVLSLLCLIPMIIGLTVYDEIPDILPNHMNFKGEIDGYASKNEVVFIMPLIMAAATIITGVATYFDPFDKRRNNKNSFLLILSLVALPVVSNLIFWLSYFWSQEKHFNSPIVFVFVGIIIIIAANYMTKNKLNSQIGFKTPWSLKDEENWNKTNRLGAYMFIFFGISFLLAPILINFFGDAIYTLYLILGCSVAVIPSIYSFIIYIKKQR